MTFFEWIVQDKWANEINLHGMSYGEQLVIKVNYSWGKMHAHRAKNQLKALNWKIICVSQVATTCDKSECVDVSEACMTHQSQFMSLMMVDERACNSLTNSGRWLRHHRSQEEHSNVLWCGLCWNEESLIERWNTNKQLVVQAKRNYTKLRTNIDVVATATKNYQKREK